MSLLSVRWDLDLVAQSSIIHRDDYSQGNATIFSLFRREEIIGAHGKRLRVPILSGNSFRGVLRRIGESLTAEILDYENSLPVPAAHLLANGGRLAKTGQPLTDEQERRLKQLLPQVAVFGGAAGGRILSGLLAVGKVLPEIAELAHLLPRPPQAEPPSAMTALSEEGFTHLDDHRLLAGQPPAPDSDRDTSPLGRYSVETLRAGTRLQTWARIDNATPTQVAFLDTVLTDFANNGHLGARSAAGHGQLSATLTRSAVRGKLPKRDADWVGELAAHRDDALAALTALT
ncbi:MAG: RAMP superfamily CRISPR-associated protein [Mycobacterium sp.]|nr:RAMP superfamily CRISPR-associated protein [Mycobacterium sp.]